jgi:energy-coupling factor transport system ATP-binding protein
MVLSTVDRRRSAKLGEGLFGSGAHHAGVKSGNVAALGARAQRGELVQRQVACGIPARLGDGLGLTEPIVVLDSFSFRYKDTDAWALSKVSLELDAGEILLVLGPSGCGKSTLGLALNGIVPELLEGDVEGSVTVAGLSTKDAKVSELATHVGMVFQDPEVQLFALTVEDEVAMSLESYGVARDEMRKRVTWAMEVCGLSGMELNAPAKLSGGQKQRVAIAAVLAREPDVLVFDEPTGNLDPVGSRSVYETIRRICDERRRTIVLVEHDLGPVIDLVDRVLVLDKGSVLAQGKPRDILHNLELLRASGVKVPVGTEFGLYLERAGIATYPVTPISLEEALAPVNGTFEWVRQVAAKSDTPEVADAMTSTPMVEFKTVSHVYDTGHKGIQEIDLQVFPGEFVAICGMNGAGKTTLSMHVMGLLQPTSGEVIVDGHNVHSRTVAEMARSVGLIFQNPNHQLFKGTVADEVAFGPRNIGWDDERIKQASRRVIELVDLVGLEDRDPDSLSIGQKQRVAVASVLVMEPRILILDEPTTGQDERTLAPFMRLVSELNQDGMTVLMITHDMDVAMRYATRMIVMGGGRILADGRPEDVFDRQDILAAAKLQSPNVAQLAGVLKLPHASFARTVSELLDSLEVNSRRTAAG